MPEKMATNGIWTHAWTPTSNRGGCIDACLLGDVTRSFQLHDIKLFNNFRSISIVLLGGRAIT